MIDIKDLRIRNHTMEGEVTAIAELITVFKSGTFDYLHDIELNPIKLTPEILEQIGAISYDWKHLDYEHYLIKANTDIVLRVVSENEIVVFTNNMCDKDNKNYICTVGALHSLQNIYYIINKQEIPININNLKV